MLYSDICRVVSLRLRGAVWSLDVVLFLLIFLFQILNKPPQVNDLTSSINGGWVERKEAVNILHNDHEL